MNGTFVNDVQIVDRCDLKHGDVIGIGCEGSVLDDSDENLPVKREDIFVYHLTKNTGINNSIVLVICYKSHSE